MNEMQILVVAIIVGAIVFLWPKFRKKQDPGQTAKGNKMPQTKEEFAYLAGKYEEAMLAMTNENRQQREKMNTLEQRHKSDQSLIEGLNEDIRQLENRLNQANHAYINLKAMLGEED